MKHFLVVVSTVVLCCVSFIAGLNRGVNWTVSVLAQDSAPKLTLEQHDAIATLKSEDLEQLLTQQSYQKKYQDMLNADPGFREATAKREAIDKQLQEKLQDAMKGVDPKKWKLDISTVKFIPVTPQEEKKK